jgi:Integrase core domain
MTRDMGMEEVLTAPRPPWQNPFLERLAGSIRRECLGQVIAWNEGSLRRTLQSYFAYYHRSRTHLSLGKEHRATSDSAAANGIRRGGAAGWWTAPALRTTGCLKRLTPARHGLSLLGPLAFVFQLCFLADACVAESPPPDSSSVAECLTFAVRPGESYSHGLHRIFGRDRSP